MKTIFVTGATGNQGGAVATNLIQNGFKVKALTRNMSSPKALALQNQNIELIQGDLNDPASYRQHLEGVYGVFSVQHTNYKVDQEIKQGKSLTDLAMEYGVEHFLYSSVTGADMKTGIPHFEGKHEIEKYIMQTGIAYTIIRPASFFENFLMPQVKNSILKGKLASPLLKDAVQQMISTEDIGKIAADIFQNKGKYFGKAFTIASEQMDTAQVAETFTKVLGYEVVYQKLPMFLVRLFLGKNLYKMFKYVNENGMTFLKDLDRFKQEHPELTPLKDWIKLHFKNT